MKRFLGLTLILGAVVLAGAVLVADDRGAAAGEEGEAAAPTLVLRGLDPVHLLAGHEMAGSEEHTAVHGRFVYRFADAASRERFLADPERYAVRNDGQCAAMPQAKGNPALFAVHDGKLYLFGSEGCRRDFVARPGLFTGETERRRVAIVLFDGVELLDFAGPGEVFAAAGHQAAFDVFTVAETTAPLTSQGFVTITPGYAIADSPRPDVVVIPGGGVRSLLASPAMMAWLEEVAAGAEVVMSVCNGAFVLAEAGLLDGLEATTHSGSIEGLRRAAPDTRVREGLRFVDNGKVVTAAGVSAGIDAALHVVSRLLDEATAARTARYMEYEWDTAARTGVTLASAAPGER